MADDNLPIGEVHNARSGACQCLRCRTLSTIRQFYVDCPMPTHEHNDLDEEIYTATVLIGIVAEIVGTLGDVSDRIHFFNAIVMRAAAIARVPVASSGVPDDDEVDPTQPPTSERKH